MMTPEATAEIAMCNECISHLLENAGPDHVIIKYRNALIKLEEQAEEIKRLKSESDDLLVRHERLTRAIKLLAIETEKQGNEVKRLQNIISGPVKSFGTPELLEWANGLQKIIADYPESERGELPFVMLMGSHLEKFAKSWNSPAMKRLEAERAVWIKHYQDNRKKHAALKKLGEMVRARGEALVEERADAIQQNPNRTWEMTRDQAIDRARKQLRAEGVIR